MQLPAATLFFGALPPKLGRPFKPEVEFWRYRAHCCEKTQKLWYLAEDYQETMGVIMLNSRQKLSGY